MKIIDFRLRPPLRGFLDTIMYSQGPRRDRITGYHGMKPARSAQEQSIDLLLKEMDEAGITRGVAMGRALQGGAALGKVTAEIHPQPLLERQRQRSWDGGPPRSRVIVST